MNESSLDTKDMRIIKSKLFISTIIFVLGYSLFSFVYNYEEKISFRQLYYVVAGIISVLTFYMVSRISLYLDQRISWIDNLGLRLLSGILVGYLIFLFSYTVLVQVYSIIADLENKEVVYKFSILLFLLSITGNAVYLVFFSYNHYAEQQLQSIQLESKQINLQLDVLKSQISPHFLFNNLNTISFLITEDAIKAKTYIRQMAHCYKYVLDSYNKVLVRLSEELSFVKAYQFLIRTRHNDAVSIKKELSEKDLSVKVPALSVQLLLENAVKHNMATAENPLVIKIHSDNNHIIVSNPKTEKRSAKKSTGIGLKNIIGRYALISNRNVEVQDGDTFVVKLPKIY